MTVELRYIARAQELDARWAEIWPLLDASDRFHATIHKQELRTGRQEWSYKRIRSGLEEGSYWLLVAEEDGELVGIGSAHLVPGTQPDSQPRGLSGDLYPKESVRGQGLSSPMYQMRLQTLREQGITLCESSTSASNARTMEIWRHRTKGCILREPLGGVPAAANAEVRGVKDPTQDWPGTRSLLRSADAASESEAQRRLQAVLSNRGAIFLAGEAPDGLIAGKVVANPWIFAERVGLVTDLQIEIGSERHFPGLTSQMEQWLASKGATEIETPALDHGAYDDWLAFGYQPHLYTFVDSESTCSRSSADEGRAVRKPGWLSCRRYRDSPA